MSRLFFALWPDAETRAQLAAVSAMLGPECGRRVSIQNLHITLAFLGNLEDGVREQIRAAATGVQGERFTLILDRIGWWRHPRVIWLAPQEFPDSVLNLVAQVGTLTSTSGIVLDDRPYRPHLTLARKVSKPPRGIRFEPICWNISNFCLVESHTRPQGAEYSVVASWPLSTIAGK